MWPSSSSTARIAIADIPVVVDHIDEGRFLAGVSGFDERSRCRGVRTSRRRYQQKLLDRASRVRAPCTGLLSCTQCWRAIARNVAGRYVTGQDDDRNVALEALRAQFRRRVRRPIHPVRQVVVRQDQVGTDRMPRATRSSACDAVRRRRWCDGLRPSSRIASRSRTSGSSSIDQNRAGAMSVVSRAAQWPPGPSGWPQLVVASAHGNARPRWRTPTLAQMRAHADAMAQQFAKTLHDGQAQPEPAAVVRARHCRADGTPRRSPGARRRECRCRCPRSRCSACRSRRRQPSSTLPRRVYFSAFDKQVADHLLEQARIALDRQACTGTTRKPRPCAFGVIGELVPQPVEQIVDREAAPFRRGPSRPRSG